MARIRTVKPEFWSSEQVMELSPLARLTFIGMWNFCDDAGVHPASAKTLKAEIFPSDDLTADRVAELVAEMIQHGLVEAFEHGGKTYWAVTGWTKHQRIDKPTFRHPRPDTTPPKASAIDDQSPKARRVLDDPSPPESNGMESKGVGTLSPPAAQPPTNDSRGSRLPTDWELPADWKDWAERERSDLDPDKVAESFKDYWLAKPGKDGRKTDWQATWRYWVRNQNAKHAAQPARSSAIFAGAL